MKGHAGTPGNAQHIAHGSRRVVGVLLKGRRSKPNFKFAEGRSTSLRIVSGMKKVLYVLSK